MRKDGLIVLEEDYKPIASALKTLKHSLLVKVIGVFGAFIFMIALPLVGLLNILFPVKKKRVMVGTHSLVSNIHYKHLLNGALLDYEIEIFVFTDWLNEPSYYDIQAKDILPKWLIFNDAYLLSPYIVFIWAMRRYRGFYWHLDGAILERTALWRWEPLLLELFSKKVIIQAYGSDQWTLLQSTDDINFKFGLSRFRKRYFMMDFKRIERSYMWAQYAHLMAGDIRYLPRVSSFSMAHFYVDLDLLPYKYNANMDKIIVSHFANHRERKGSYAIEAICGELKSEGYNIEYRSIYGVSREEALAILDESHIFIEHLFNGVMGTGALEAMAKGNVVLTNFDQRLIDFCLVQNYVFYAPFFKEMPMVNVSVYTLKQAIVSLIEDKDRLKKRIEDSRKFVELSSKRVVDGFKNESMIKQIFED
ncbi:MAG: hypothetical protein EOM50_05410 [Erysipelotrichia bacterium]|nr:hypothetical protein [Erysipelotrichia bacterium]